MFIFKLLDVNFENLTVRLHILIISSILAKFQESKKLIVMSLIKYLNLKFLESKIMHKNKFIDWTYPIWSKFDMCIKNIETMHSNG